MYFYNIFLLILSVLNKDSNIHDLVKGIIKIINVEMRIARL